ncbi:MAG: 30S ribosomal protein S6 [Erysipelotrichaceae bacterium]|nr:30S ribosomal protein S6 [Erysipelotrichaceae bacterium]
MTKYEIMYILNAELDEATRNQEIAALAKILSDNGAKVLETNEWGVRELAYEIKFQKRGYYVVLTLEASDNKATEEFKRLTTINKNVLRSLIVRI